MKQAMVGVEVAVAVYVQFIRGTNFKFSLID